MEMCANDADIPHVVSCSSRGLLEVVNVPVLGGRAGDAREVGEVSGGVVEVVPRQ